MKIKPTLYAIAVGSIGLWPMASASAQTANDLWRQGYSVIEEFGYVEVEECEPDAPIDLEGSSYFECLGYEYPYHYGAATLVGKVVTYQGRRLSLTYLCLDGGDCLSGTIVSAPMFKGYRCTDDCSGHQAGYEWAEARGITDPYDCGGRSLSFIEGCMAYAEGR